MKVKVMFETEYLNLEKKINEFLEPFMGKIIDIKFSAVVDPAHSIDSVPVHSKFHYSVLIMYEPSVAD